MRLLKFCTIFFLSICGLWADGTFAVLSLKDGRVLHNVKVLKPHALTLNIASDEGLFQIKKSILPPEVAALFPIDKEAAAQEEKEAALQQASAQQAEEARRLYALERQKQRSQEIEQRTVRNGCRITTFQPIDAGVAVVEIRNESNTPAQINPNEIVCRASDDRIFDGFWVSRSGTRLIDHLVHVPGNSVAHIRIFFFRNKTISISDVYWK